MWEGAHPPMILWSSINGKHVPPTIRVGGIFVIYREVKILEKSQFYLNIRGDGETFKGGEADGRFKQQANGNDLCRRL